MAKPNTLGKSNLHLCFSVIKCSQVPHKCTTKTSSNSPPQIFQDSDDDVAGVGPATPDLTAIHASRRFFVSSPGRSNSIVDSLSFSSSSTSSAASPEEVAGGVPVLTYSPNPYVDFRRSMEEMVEARGVEGKEVWDYLQELLLSYLSLNPKGTHKYIIRAFSDLVASMFISKTMNQ